MISGPRRLSERLVRGRRMRRRIFVAARRWRSTYSRHRSMTWRPLPMTVRSTWRGGSSMSDLIGVIYAMRAQIARVRTNGFATPEKPGAIVNVGVCSGVRRRADAVGVLGCQARRGGSDEIRGTRICPAAAVAGQRSLPFCPSFAPDRPMAETFLFDKAGKDRDAAEAFLVQALPCDGSRKSTRLMAGGITFSSPIPASSFVTWARRCRSDGACRRRDGALIFCTTVCTFGRV